MGGTRFFAYNAVAKDIWQFAEKRRIFIFATYIASSDNRQADFLSRIKNNDTEWELNQNCFQVIVRNFGIPDYDLFATNRNAKCKNFFSWKPDNAALQIDSFTIKWTDLNFYAFPPFSLILKTLVKIKKDEARGIIVVPHWPNQSWYPLLLDLIVDRPIHFQPNVNLLLSPCRTVTHPQAQNLSLMACKVSGKAL